MNNSWFGQAALVGLFWWGPWRTVHEEGSSFVNPLLLDRHTVVPVVANVFPWNVTKASNSFKAINRAVQVIANRQNQSCPFLIRKTLFF